MKFDIEEFNRIGLALERHHGVFSKLWSIGIPRFTTTTNTAAIRFNKEGNCIDFVINPDFWNSITFYDKLFVICHECIHVLYNHEKRGTGIPNDLKQLANIAMDISDNHTLLSKFEFDRNRLTNSENYCWIDTVFKNKPNIPIDMNFEYYYDLLLKNVINYKLLVDDHSELEEIDDDIIDKVINELNDDEKEELSDILEAEQKNLKSIAGTDTNSLSKILDSFVKVKQTRKWGTLIKKWNITNRKEQYFEQWTRTNRRFQSIMENEFFIPTIMEKDDDKKRALVWFFLDTSGSCVSFGPRFFNAALSVPKNYFKLNLFCFDTKVYPTNLKTKKLYGFGGTSFSCIEKYINDNAKKYPDYVFIITDGEGDYVYPKKPENWYWFLTTDNSRCRRYIPEKSKTFLLSDFE